MRVHKYRRAQQERRPEALTDLRQRRARGRVYHRLGTRGGSVRAAKLLGSRVELKIDVILLYLPGGSIAGASKGLGGAKGAESRGMRPAGPGETKPWWMRGAGAGAGAGLGARAGAGAGATNPWWGRGAGAGTGAGSEAGGVP
jgi:hypothetical protein